MTKRTKKILIWSCSILAGLLLITGVTVCIILAKLIDDAPMELRKDINFMSSLTAMNKVVRARKTLRHTVPNQEEKLVLSENEVNALLHTLLRKPPKPKAEASLELENMDLTLKDGVFTLRAVLKLRSKTIFGQYLNAVIRFRFSCENGKENVAVLSAKSGTMPISREHCLKGYKEFRDRYFTGTQYEKFLQACIRKAETGSDNSAVIIYSPYNIVGEIDRLFYNGSGDFRKMMDNDDD